MNTLRISRQFYIFRSFSTSSVHRASLGACGEKPSYGPLEIERCTLMNGIKLVSARPFGAQMASCTILFQSGSRFECDDQLGATHFLRTCSTASGCSYSTFAKTRVLQQLGSYITVNSDRQSIAYTLRCPVPAFHDVKYYFLDIAARASFVQHEIDARKPQLKLDLETMQPEVRVMDLIQKALWGGGLNNSVFCTKERIDSMSAHDLDAFSSLYMRSDVCTVGSYGLPFDQLMLFAEQIDSNRNCQTEDHEACIQLPFEEYTLLGRKINFPQGKPRQVLCYPCSFPRGGFEYHDLGPDSDTWIAVAVPGCGSCDLPDLMKHSIIAAACGTGYNTRGQHSEDRMPQPPLGCYATDVFTEFKAFNVSFSDTGLFGEFWVATGILVKTPSYNAATAACTAASFLKKIGDLKPNQIGVGKERLKLEIALLEDDCVSISEGLALQAAFGTRLDNAYCTNMFLDTISESEVVKWLSQWSATSKQYPMIRRYFAFVDGIRLLYTE